MPASQAHIGPDTPMGAHTLDGGATFRVWAPRAEHVYLALEGAAALGPEAELVKDPDTRRG